jgi:soluble lytic murein transglycosylase
LGVGINRVCISALGRGAIAQAKGPLRRCALVSLLASAMIALGVADAASTPAQKHAPSHKSKAAKTEHHKLGSAPKVMRTERAAGPRIPLPNDQPTTGKLAPAPQLSRDLAATKQAIELVRQRKFSDATTVAASITDPVAQKLVEWALLRNADSTAGFDRYTSFIQANGNWPSIRLLRRRAEAKLWQSHRDPATMHRFFGEQPVSALGRLVLAQVQLREGNRADAVRQIRALWQLAEMSADLEAAVAQEFHDELTLADNVARMDRRIGAKDFGSAMRVAKRLGPAQVSIVKACEAVEANSTKSGALLEAVPHEVRTDLGYALCRLHWLLAHDELATAAKVVAESARNELQHQNTDEWWRECRILARKLIDRGDAKAAYRVVRQSAAPANPYYRAEYHFMAGWIALRFLDDPGTALEHFIHVDEGSADPIVMARAAYWRGRAAEAAGQLEEMKTQYQTAAQYPTAYYGQLARARLGLSQFSLGLSRPRSVDGAQSELLHAAEILYRIGEFDLVLSFVSDLAETSRDVATLNGLGELTARYNDAQAMLIIGKTALARGLSTAQYAFPKIGIPSYRPIAPSVDQRVVYSIVRTESAFDQRDISPAKAVGLMQVTPEAGRDTAKRFGVAYDWKRLVSDPVYNMQMGAAEISALFKEYTGSYIMTFAGYNAGRGRVRQWVAQHGDPRDPKVDPVDWVERIPLAETRNYVQRVMENLQVYSALFGTSIATVEPNLYRAAMIEWRATPASLVQSIP